MAKQSLISEFWEFAKLRKRYWLLPIIIVMLLFSAVIVFTEPTDKFVNQSLNLTGNESLNFYDVSKIMTKVLGEEIKYSNPKGKLFIKVMASYGFPKDMIKVMKMIYLIVKLGKAGDLYDDTEEILGREPITMEQYVQDYAACWQ